jgi:hypothetical protein
MGGDTVCCGCRVRFLYSQMQRPDRKGRNFSGVRNCKKSSSRPGFSGRFCNYWPGFSGRNFSGMGDCKITLKAAGKLFWYRQRDFLSLKVHKRENFLGSDIEICTFS